MKNILFFAVALSLFACGKKEVSQGKIDETIAVRLVPVETIVMPRNILASGVVGSASEARLGFKIGGIIEQIYVEEGQNVVQGQVLARLNMTEIAAQVAQSQEGFAKAERDLGRVRNLYTDSVATKEQLQNAQTAFSVAQQNTKIATFNQSFAEIRASMTGKIVKKMMNEGEVVGAGTPVFFVVANTTNDWVVNVGLADRDWARLKIGDKAKISLDAYPEQTFEGKITQLAETADLQTGTFEAEIRLVPPQGIKLAAGLLAAVELMPIQEKAQTVIPLSALVESNGRNGVVYTVDNQQIAQKINVKLAYLAGEKVVVEQGLENIKNVVSAGSPYLSAGEKVIVQQ